MNPGKDKTENDKPEIDPFLRVKDLCSVHFDDYVILARSKEKDGSKILRWYFTDHCWAMGALERLSMYLHESEVVNSEPGNEQENKNEKDGD